MTETKCPTCEEHTSSKQTPTGRDYCTRCGTIKSGEKPETTETDFA